MASLLNLNLALLFAGVRIKHSSSDQAAGQVDRWEIISASNFLEANDSVLRDSVNKQDDGGKHLNLELCNKERCTLGIQTHKTALFMLAADFLNVHVDDLAALEVLVEEGDRDVL